MNQEATDLSYPKASLMPREALGLWIASKLERMASLCSTVRQSAARQGLIAPLLRSLAATAELGSRIASELYPSSSLIKCHAPPVLCLRKHAVSRATERCINGLPARFYAMSAACAGRPHRSRLTPWLRQSHQPPSSIGCKKETRKAKSNSDGTGLNRDSNPRPRTSLFACVQARAD